MSLLLDGKVINKNKLIGTGAFSKIYEGTYHGSTVAVKLISSERFNKDIFANEVQSLFNIKHPRCVSIQGYLSEPEPGIILNLYSTTLHQLIQNYTLELRIKKTLAKDIISGLAYLHSRGMIHRDLKPGNILITSLKEPRADISDFGTLTIIEDSTYYTTLNLTGTPFYISPEATIDLKYSVYSDYYSLGIILWQIFEQKLPYHHIPDYYKSNPVTVLTSIHIKKQRPIFEDINKYPELKDNIEKLWHEDVAVRKTINLLSLIDTIDNINNY